MGVRVLKSPRKKDGTAVPARDGGRRGRIGFEWTQHSMFYRGSTLAECLCRAPLCPVALREERIHPGSRNKGVGGVTSREGRWISRASFFSLFISPSSGSSPVPPRCRDGSAYRWHRLFVPSRTTNSLLVILRRWSFRAPETLLRSAPRLFAAERIAPIDSSGCT